MEDFVVVGYNVWFFYGSIFALEFVENALRFNIFYVQNTWT